MQTLLDMTDRPVNPHGPTLEDIRARAQAEADKCGVAIAIGWQVNDTTGEKEYGCCPASVAPHNCFVVEVLETVSPYRGGRADYAQRQERRRDRLESAAERAAREADSRFTRARSAIAGIPSGQPILVGHHSERRHRRDLAKHDQNMRAGIDAQERAQDLAGRAASVGTGGISSDDPEALVKLREKLAGMTKLQEVMKAANRVIRKHKAQETAVPELVALGFGEVQARKLLTPDFCGRIGFADYETKNNNANMRRVRERIAVLEREAAQAQEEEGERARSQRGVVYRIEDNRVQLVFPGKPEEAVRARLKQHGFRWSPAAGAWQRHLNNAGRYWASEFIKWLDSTYPQEG